MKKLVSTLQLSREEWLRYRKQGIGGSDAGTVCGLNPYRTAAHVYLDKIVVRQINRCFSLQIKTDILMLNAA